MLRRIVGSAVIATALFAAAGCGSAGNDASIGTGSTDREQRVVPADDSVSATGLRTVTYRGVQFDVPADWPVHDLSASPTTCVRFDVSAVYLGHPSADMDCPAGIVGRSDAVLLEPADGTREQRQGSNGGSSDTTGVSTATARGLDVQVTSEGAAESEVAATILSADVDVTLTYRDSDATAQQILQSFRSVAR